MDEYLKPEEIDNSTDFGCQSNKDDDMELLYISEVSD